MKKTWIILGFILLVGAVVAVRYPAKDNSDAAPADQAQGATADNDKDRRAAELLRKKGAGPMDMALSRATNDRQKARIRERLAYQSQTKQDASARAEKKRAEIEARLASGNVSPEEKETLTLQLRALNRIVTELD